MKDLFEKYILIDKQLKELEDKKEELKAEIFSDMKARGSEKEESEFGTFLVVKKSNWKYTSAVRQLEEKVTLAKLKEQRLGKAEHSVTEYLRFGHKVDEQDL